MNRLSFLLLAALVACGGSSPKKTNFPLPEDKAPVADAKPAETKQVPPAPEPQPQLPPLEVTLAAPTTTVKLVSAGKGKKAPLRYTAKAGGKQQLEVAMDFASKQTLDGQTDEQIVPTVVLAGEAETKSVAADGKTEYAFAIATTDARDIAGSAVPVDKFKIALSALAGLVIGGSVDANGTAGDVTLRIEKPAAMSAGALDLIRLTLPAWPMFPKEPVGVGAKWKATSNQKLADKLEVTQVTDYELVAHEGTSWTIKGKTTVTGKDQEVSGGKITKISGAGTAEIKIADGALYPSHKSQVETSFTAIEGDKSMVFQIKIGGTVVPK